MKKNKNNKGFTLIELLATIVLLSILMGIGTFTITNIIKNAKDENYNLLISQIKDATNVYYQECKYFDNNCKSELTLQELVSYGYLKSNAKDNSNKLINPNTDEDISTCKIEILPPFNEQRTGTNRSWTGTNPANSKSILNNIQPNTTYTVTMLTATITPNSQGTFTTAFWDNTASKIVGTKLEVTPGNNITYSITSPNFDSTHEVYLTVYAGKYGYCEGTTAEYSGITVVASRPLTTTNKSTDNICKKITY